MNFNITQSCIIYANTALPADAQKEILHKDFTIINTQIELSKAQKIN